MVAGAAVLCALGWAASLFPLVAGTVAASVVLIAAVVALRRHLAARARIERDICAQSTAGWGPWAGEEFGEAIDGPGLGVVDDEQEAA